MAALIGIKLTGHQLVGRRIKGMQDYLEDLSEIADWMRDRFNIEVVGNFERGGPPDKPWKPLSAYTEHARATNEGYYEQPGLGGILNWTGSLAHSFTHRGKHSHLRITKRSRGTLEMEFGTNHPLAVIHHFGASFERGPVSPQNGSVLKIVGKGVTYFAKSAKSASIKIPARPMWSEEQLQGIQDAGREMALEAIEAIANG